MDRNCDICCKRADYWCAGICNHPVCLFCAIRLRVLCETKECPICRTEIVKIYVTKRKTPDVAKADQFYSDQDYAESFGFMFQDDDAIYVFYDILSLRCQICAERSAEFENTQQLSSHLRKVHEMYFCDLCLENLKLFAWERKLYTRQQLATHRRVGDENDKSHKGHPNCEFCDERYMDNEQLYRHLRRDHYYCHFCDADGQNKFYNDYPELRQHFAKDHFVCEEGDCRNERFTSVFRTDIDMKAHKASKHGREMQKQQLKQERTLQLDFKFENDPGQRRRGGKAGSGQHDGRRGEFHRETADGGSRGSGSGWEHKRGKVQMQSREHADLQTALQESMAAERAKAPEKATFVVQNPDMEFPSLGHGSRGDSEKKVPLGSRTMASTVIRGSAHLSRTGSLDENEFPTLAIADDAGNSRSATRSPLLTTAGARKAGQMDVQRSSAPGSPKGSHRAVPKKPGIAMYDYDDFPSLSGPRKPKAVVAAPVPATEPSQSADSGTDVIPLAEQLKVAKLDTAGASQAPKIDYQSVSFKEILDRPKEAGQWAQKLGEKPNTESVADFPTLDGADSKRLRGFRQVKSGMQSSSVWSKQKNDSGITPSESTKPPQHAVNGAASTQGKLPETGALEKLPKTKAKKLTAGKATAKEKAVEADRVKTTHFIPQDDNKKASEKQLVANEQHYPDLPPGLDFAPPGLSLPSTVPNVQTAAPDNNAEPVYIKPPDFGRRNMELFERIERRLQQNEVGDFKVISGQFRHGKMSAQRYLQSVQDLLGLELFERIFPDLVTLLPSIPRQRELLEAVNNASRQSKLQSGWSVLGTGVSSDLNVCAMCGQVLVRRDAAHHQTSHQLDENFPAL